MIKNKLLFRLALVQLLVLAIMASLTFVFTDYYYRQAFAEQAKRQISLELDTFAEIAHGLKGDGDACARLYQFKTLRLSLIESSGKVLCDSLQIEDQMENHLNRPEIKALDSAPIGFHRRTSSTSSVSYIYGAKKLSIADKHYFIRAAFSLEDYHHLVLSIWVRIILFILPLLFGTSVLLIILLYRHDQRRQCQHQKLKGDLVANISHEVRTPLTSIAGYLQLLVDSKLELTADQKDYFSRLDLGVKQLHGLFADVLELSLLENEMPLNEEWINSRDFLEQILYKLEGSYRHKQLDIQLDIADFEFWGDGKLLEMVFKNIIDNACKYSRERGEIKLIFKLDGEFCRFICRDRGEGIPVEAQARVFERFYRGDGTRERGIAGSGLGLSIAKHAINRHLGRIWFASVENQGTSFFVEFPSNPHHS